MITLFRDWGVNSAITRYTPNLRAESKMDDTQDIIRAGLIFEVVTGTALTLVFSTFSKLHPKFPYGTFTSRADMIIIMSGFMVLKNSYDMLLGMYIIEI